MKKKIFAFCGASGTGKSTLLKYIKDNYDIPIKELSGRDFLPKNDSYDKTLTDQIQVLITYNRLVEIVNFLVSEDKAICYSRSNLDTYSYSKVLKKAEFLNKLQKKEIKTLKNNIVYFYIPIEFKMTETEDIVRGTNEEVQKATDEEIKDVIKKFRLEKQVVELRGTVQERESIIDRVFLENGICKLDKNSTL